MQLRQALLTIGVRGIRSARRKSRPPAPVSRDQFQGLKLIAPIAWKEGKRSCSGSFAPRARILGRFRNIPPQPTDGPRAKI